MNILVTIGIYSMLNVMQGDTILYCQPYCCLLNLKKLERYMFQHEDEKVCLSRKSEISEINQFRDTCKNTCNELWPLQTIQRNTGQRKCQTLTMVVNLNGETVFKRDYKRECKTNCSTAITCEINVQPKDVMQLIHLVLDEQDFCACREHSCDLCTTTTISTQKLCTTEAVSTEEQNQILTTLSGNNDHLQDRSGIDESDCPGIAVGVGFLGIVVGVILTSALCICWSRCRQQKRSFEGQAMTNKGYFSTGDEQIHDVGSKPRQRSVIYTEINDDPTHGQPKISHVAPIIRDTEGKPNSGPNDKNIYNYLNEEIKEDDADDYDHARPSPVQNNDTENGYGKLDKMADISKSVQDDKRVSSSSMNHDYGELEIEEIEGVKRFDDETKGTETDEIVGNGDEDNYFTLERSHI